MSFDHPSSPSRLARAGANRRERRQSERHSFPSLQQVRAVMHDGSSHPTRWSRFHDLSEEGVSFWTTVAVPTDRYTIRLGEDDEAVEMLAEVCHTTAIHCLQEPLYLIGCRFLERTDLDEWIGLMSPAACG